MKKFEYCEKEFEEWIFIESLNDMGKEGWEVVSIKEGRKEYTDTEWQKQTKTMKKAIFKREKTKPKPQKTTNNFGRPSSPYDLNDTANHMRKLRKKR